MAQNFYAQLSNEMEKVVSHLQVTKSVTKIVTNNDEYPTLQKVGITKVVRTPNNDMVALITKTMTPDEMLPLVASLVECDVMPIWCDEDICKAQEMIILSHYADIINEQDDYDLESSEQLLALGYIESPNDYDIVKGDYYKLTFNEQGKAEVLEIR